MATTITAGNATNGAAVSSDNTGILELKTGTGAGTTALTLSTAQAATFAGAVSVTGNATLPTIRSNAVSTPPTIQDSAGTQIGTFCRAWVNFNGTTVTNPASMTGVRASFNVSSILDNGAGNYTINFTTAMPDANYAPNITASRDGAAQGNVYNAPVHESLTASAYQLITYGYGGYNFGDHQIVTVAIFR